MPASRRFLILAAVVLVGICWVSAAAAYTLEIEAFIDGRDDLIIQGSTLQWQHFDYTAVGWHEGGGGSGPPYPTYITTAAMGTVDWYPGWPSGTGYGAYSSVYTGLNPALPAIAQIVSFTAVQARDSAYIVQQPSAANSYTFIAEFNDDPSGGAYWYEIGLDYTTVPLPGAVWLLGSGLVGLAARRRFRKS